MDPSPDRRSPRARARAESGRRPRQAALILVLGLAGLAAVHAAVGLAPPVLYGVGGGLLVSLLIVGLDRLHGSRGRTSRARGRDAAEPPDRTPG